METVVRWSIPEEPHGRNKRMNWKDWKYFYLALAASIALLVTAGILVFSTVMSQTNDECSPSIEVDLCLAILAIFVIIALLITAGVLIFSLVITADILEFSTVMSLINDECNSSIEADDFIDVNGNQLEIIVENEEGSDTQRIQ